MSSSMSVLMTGSEWFSSRPGGLNRYFYELFRALSLEPKTSIGAAAFGDAPDIPGAISWAGGSGIERVLGSRRKIDGVEPDVVDRHFALYGPPRRVHPGAIQVVHFQGPWALESRASGMGRANVMVKRFVESARYRSADHFVVLSPAFADLLVTNYGVDESSVSIIPPGVDVERFASVRVPAETKRPVVLCVRRLEARMGIDVLLRAWDEVVSRCPDAELRIVGTGSNEKKLREQALELRNAQSVVFTGRLSDDALDAEYAAATVSVVPTLELEGFGLIALESLAAGVPPVVTNCGGLPAAVRDLDDSLIVEVGNEEALSERLVRALDGQRPDRDACVEHARRFSWDAVARRHLVLYESLKH